MPLAVPKAEIWVWNSRWKAALFVANNVASRGSPAFSAWRSTGGVAFIAISLLAYSKKLVIVAWLTPGPLVGQTSSPFCRAHAPVVRCWCRIRQGRTRLANRALR